MKKFNKILSVGLSLVMCAGMVMPAFAASVSLNTRNDEGGYRYIGSDGTLLAHENDDGSTSYDYHLEGDLTLDKTLVVSGSDVKASIAMNGYELALNKGMTVEVDKQGKATYKVNGETVSESTLKKGAVIFVTNGAALTINAQNGGTITGGGLFNGWACNGGGVVVGSANQNTTGTFTMNGGTISNNYTTNTYQGGGISAWNGSTVTLYGTTLRNNATQRNGGGVHASGAGTMLTITGATIEENFAGAMGGGVCVVDGASLSITGSVVRNNTAKTNGGGMAVGNTNGTEFDMDNTQILDNTGGYGGGIWISTPDRVSIQNSIISGNKATVKSVYSSGIVMEPYGTPTEHFHDSSVLKNTIVCNNTVLGEESNLWTVENGNSADPIHQDSKWADWSEWKIVKEATPDEPGILTRTCKYCGAEETMEYDYEEVIEPVEDDGDDTTVIDRNAPENTSVATTGIDDEAVPLASGPVTRAEFIDYLWRHEGEPEAEVVVDHEYAPAISWALSIDIISEDTFEADELVTVADAREILANFARVFELDVDVSALTSLTGADDEAVLNCDEVIAEFFGEELSGADIAA